MKFSKLNFEKTARPSTKKLLPISHRIVLDGKEVVDEQIEYQVDGEEYYLYPVPGEWCK